MNKINRRSPFAIVGRLIVLVKPMLPIMLAAIVMGVAGHFCATFITIFGGFGILRALGLASPVRTVGTAFACILVFALLRGVLRYAEQASNHYIAFKLLALIRDKVFGALRRLTPAKLEGRDRGDLISLITADIEALEVFYAHTISPICIACICVIGMTGFVGSWHILPALVLLAGILKKVCANYNGVLARYGGDEFCIACGCNSVEVRTLIASIQRELDAANAASGKPYQIEISIGCARLEPDIATVHDLIDKADQEMYHLKTRKRGTAPAEKQG